MIKFTIILFHLTHTSKQTTIKMISNNTTGYKAWKKARVDELVSKAKEEGNKLGRREAGKMAKEEWPSVLARIQENNVEEEIVAETKEVDAPKIKPENFSKYLEFKKARVEEIVSENKEIKRREAGKTAKAEWDVHQDLKVEEPAQVTAPAAEEPVAVSAPKAPKKKTAYAIFKESRISELMEENENLTKREAGKIIREEWKAKKEQDKKDKEMKRLIKKLPKQAAKEARAFKKRRMILKKWKRSTKKVAKEAAKQARAIIKKAKKAEREAKKAEREAKKAEREAKKAEREAKKAEREAKKAEREAKKAEREAMKKEDKKTSRVMPAFLLEHAK